MDILEKIVVSKQAEVALDKELHPIDLLEKSPLFNRETVSLKQALSGVNECGIIAEFKRKSPSKGLINDTAWVAETTQAYVSAGARALSVLTNKVFFGGSNADLISARLNNTCPILRKDFIVDEYQIIEARSIGADAILLIAALLTPDQVKSFTTAAHNLGMEVLLEVHEATELNCLHPDIDVVGVNNRNLKSFVTDIEKSLELLPSIPSDFIKISESGITTPDVALALRRKGFNGFLIGEQFMKHTNPGEACASFITTLKQYLYEN
jgi:indole-3-glycerol phosphate synthase